MSFEEMLAQCVQFFMAGYDTTASLIALSLYYLALNPDKQEQAYLNICETIFENIGLERKTEINAEDYNLQLLSYECYQNRLEYISAIINETLRLAPPIPVTERRCMKDCTLITDDGKYRISVKKDNIIQIPIWAMHYNDEYFPQPEQFIPERFCTDTGQNFPKYAFLPFGSGPRACVAKSLALLEVKMALVNLIWNFKFIKCDKTKVGYLIKFSSKIYYF